MKTPLLTQDYNDNSNLHEHLDEPSTIGNNRRSSALNNTGNNCSFELSNLSMKDYLLSNINSNNNNNNNNNNNSTNLNHQYQTRNNNNNCNSTRLSASFDTTKVHTALLNPPGMMHSPGQHLHPSSNTTFNATSSAIFCRICYTNDSKESLMNWCNCSGTMGLMHKSCLERWLSQSNLNNCEICKYEFTVHKVPRSFTQWLCRPLSYRDNKNLLNDLVCFLILTPLACISTWYCALFALKFHESDNRWEASGLVILTSFLLFIYLLWLTFSCKYHYKVFKEWQKKNQIVTLDESEYHRMMINEETSVSQAPSHRYADNLNTFNVNAQVPSQQDQQQQRNPSRDHQSSSQTLMQFESTHIQASSMDQTQLSNLDVSNTVLNHNLDIKLKNILKLNRQSTTENDSNAHQPSSLSIIV